MMSESKEVCLLHIRKFDFNPTDKELADNDCIPDIKLSTGYVDLAFSSEELADKYLEDLLGISINEVYPDLCWDEWIRIDLDDTVWYIYYEEPYPLDQSPEIAKERLI